MAVGAGDWASLKFGRVLTAVAFIVLALAGRAQAMHVDEYVPALHWSGRAVVLPSGIFRNGDWFAFGAIGIVTASPRTCGRYVAATVRAEVGVAGAAAGIGFATNIAEATCQLNEALVGSGLVGVEVRLARMYGSTTWRRTEYAGGQLSLAVSDTMRLTAGLMVDAHDHLDRHGQFGVGVSF